MKLLVYLFCICLFLSSCLRGKNIRMEDIQNEMKSSVGNVYVIGKDTCMIVDYNSFITQYTMSDGRKVDISLIEKLKPIK